MDHQTISATIGAGSDVIARRWLERLAERVALDREFVFPSEDLLDGIPDLVEAIAAHVGSDEHEISANLAAQEKARELGRLRYDQGFSARQILWEYELLGSIMLYYLEEAGHSHLPSIRRLMSALSLVQRVTMEEYTAEAEMRIRDREERLRVFQHALTHELRNEIGVVLGGARMLKEDFVIARAAERERFIDMVIDNSERLRVLLENLLELARIDLDTRQNRRMLLEHATAEALRRLRGYALTKGVRLEMEGDMPALEVSAAVADFCLTNLIANAIKYSDPAKPDRWVSVRATSAAREDGRAAVIEVCDNGRGVPEAERDRLFNRYFRSTNAAEEQGTGLGLALVREFVERNGGAIWAEFPPGVTKFVFSLPARRADDP